MTGGSHPSSPIEGTDGDGRMAMDGWRWTDGDGRMGQRPASCEQPASTDQGQLLSFRRVQPRPLQRPATIPGALLPSAGRGACARSMETRHGRDFLYITSEVLAAGAKCRSEERRHPFSGIVHTFPGKWAGRTDWHSWNTRYIPALPRATIQRVDRPVPADSTSVRGVLRRCIPPWDSGTSNGRD